MNRLEKTVRKLQKYPNWVLSWAIGRQVRFVGTAGIKFEAFSTEKVVLYLPNRGKVRNHIGQIHAAAMVLLVETATGMITGINLPDDKLPLMKKLETKFIKRSQGGMRVEAWLSEEQKQKMQSEAKGDILVNYKISDESGEPPIVGDYHWAWIPKKKR
ncbi:MAG: DUF4442 domain-containing protein [Bacteroidota bacterium]